MSNLVLTFNGPATEKIGANTRLRVKSMKRGGVDYVALRPSYRVSGKNAMIRTSKNEDGTFCAELPETMFTELTLPELKSNHTHYLMDDVGYGWFLMRDGSEANEKKDAIITVTKARKSARKKSADDESQHHDESSGGHPEAPASDTGPSGANQEVVAEGHAVNDAAPTGHEPTDATPDTPQEPKADGEGSGDAQSASGEGETTSSPKRTHRKAPHPKKEVEPEAKSEGDAVAG
jgi:hypothetical protein